MRIYKKFQTNTKHRMFAAPAAHVRTEREKDTHTHMEMHTHTHIKTKRERDRETERREGPSPTSLTLLVVCCTSSACNWVSLVNSWWDVERRWPREDFFSFLGLIWQIWGCRCLLGVLGVDVITRSFKAATSPWRIST